MGRKRVETHNRMRTMHKPSQLLYKNENQFAVPGRENGETFSTAASDYATAASEAVSQAVGSLFTASTDDAAIVKKRDGDLEDPIKEKILDESDDPCGTLEVHFFCAPRVAGGLLNISAKFWRISSPD